MAMSWVTKMDILLQEINKLNTLLVKVDEGSEPLDAVTEQKQKVLDVLPETVPPYNDKCPIHWYLRCGPLRRTEIPLDVIEKLIESGFDVHARIDDDDDDADVYNFTDRRTEHTCLNVAIKNEHYSAVPYLVQHGADCELGSMVPRHPDCLKTPIAELALKANAPLDLFDMLATPRTLMNNGDNQYLPLHSALGGGHNENALRLIKLGADINLKVYSEQPLRRYVNGIKEYNDELFVRIMVTDTIDILQCVSQIVHNVSYMEEYQDKMPRSKMIQRLLQNVEETDHLRVDIEMDYSSHTHFSTMAIKYDGELLFRLPKEQIYVWSVLLVNLGWAFGSIPQAIVPLLHDSAHEDDVQLAHKIDDIWNMYRDTGAVLSLQNVCIQQTRRSMRREFHESASSKQATEVADVLLRCRHCV